MSRRARRPSAIRGVKLALALALAPALIASSSHAAEHAAGHAAKHQASHKDRHPSRHTGARGEQSIQAMSPSFLYLAAEDALLRDQPALAARFLKVVVAKDPSAALPRIELAELMMRGGQTAQARELLQGLETASLSDDLRDRADMLRVQIFLGKRNRDAAIQTLTDMLKRRPEADDARLMLVHLLEEEHRYREAHRLARQAARSGRPERWMRVEAELYAREGKFSKARRVLKKLRRLRPDDARPVLMLAQILAQRGDAAAAERALRDFLAGHPHHLAVSNALGRLLVRQNRGREAIAIYEDIANTTGGNPEVLIALGLLYYQQKDYAHAAERFRASLARKPSDRARYYLAASLDALGQGDAARKLYRQIDRRSPDFARAQMRLAAMDIQANRLDAAERRMRELIRAHPDAADAHALLASILVQQKRFREALKTTETALAIPGAPADRLLFDRAAAFEGLKRYDEAARTIRKLLDRHPDDAEALNFLGYLYAEQGAHLKEAERLIRKALKLKPGNGYYLDSLAWTYYKEGRYRKAARIQKQAVAKVSDDPVMREHLGDILWRTGDHDGARKAWRRALKLGHDEPERLRKKIESGL